MKTQLLPLLLAVMLTATACQKAEPAPLADRIKKVWTVQSATENGTLVFLKGATSNVRNYGSYRLDLSKPPTVTLTEVDGNTFTGQYTLQNDNRLILSGLTPQPTGSGGRLEYVLGAVSDNSMDLSQASANLKTGNTLNTYKLATP
ncbi:hypothetical protein [Fibrella aquatilis]|uniref:Lipocalin-like domain-containing protein n=1 Tax=Fibrella aquatilis TaxID=2817059 RepID=A0A939K3J8_9BACT|nr:hypothetical protein [Fibrella aquatilis]MBO0934420.1 hypothetical protein [Fibrella aquatilis]